jgi:hypothetical protein
MYYLVRITRPSTPFLGHNTYGRGVLLVLKALRRRIILYYHQNGVRRGWKYEDWNSSLHNSSSRLSDHVLPVQQMMDDDIYNVPWPDIDDHAPEEEEE